MKKSRYNMHFEFKIMDVIIAAICIIGLIGLVLVVRYDKHRTRLEQNKLEEVGNYYQGRELNGSIYEYLEFLTINEVNYEGWIELYNRGNNADIELTNCYITVNGIKKYTFQESDILKAAGFLCIEGLGRLGNTQNDIIGIYDEDGNNLKNLMLPRLDSGESYGCKNDGELTRAYLAASKAESNSKSTIIQKDRLTFSVPGGFYDEKFRLEITAAEGMTIYYTLDGSEPTVQSQIYQEPILIENKSGSNIRYAIAEGIDFLNSYRPSSISMGMVVRAIAVDSSGIRRDSYSQSYFVGLKNASDIVNLPVLSITTAPEHLFDYFNGIYVSGRSYEDALARGEEGSGAANYMNNWEREVYVEFFEPKKDKTFESKMSLSILKDLSVTSPQKSLLLTAKGGSFAGSSLIKYYNNTSNRLIVQTNRKDNNYKIREYLAGRLLADCSIGTADITPCIVFINGEYWGGYMLRAEYDEKYINRHYAVDEDDILIANNGRISNKTGYQQVYNELYDFIQHNDLKEDENYKWIQAHLDIQNYLEYICANMYLANAEFGLDNLVMWRTIEDQGSGYQDGKWRFLMPRLDNTMKNKAAGVIATNSINTFLQSGLMEDTLFQSLLRNAEFKKQLYVVMTDMSDNIFTSDRVSTALTEITMQCKKMAIMNYKRYIGNQGDTLYIKEVDEIESFFQQRSKYMLRYAEEVISREASIHISDDAISE